jgi:hypothetical protein
MTTDGLELHLDPERLRRLSTIADARGASVDAVVGDLIDQAYANVDRAELIRRWFLNNEAFLKMVRAAQQDERAGRFISLDELKRKYPAD